MLMFEKTHNKRPFAMNLPQNLPPHFEHTIPLLLSLLEAILKVLFCEHFYCAVAASWVPQIGSECSLFLGILAVEKIQKSHGDRSS